MKTIYIASTHGPDPIVVGAFSDLKTAERMDDVLLDGIFVDAVELDQFAAALEAGKRPYDIVVRKDRIVERIEKANSLNLDESETVWPVRGKRTQPAVRVVVWAVDRNAAIRHALSVMDRLEANGEI